MKTVHHIGRRKTSIARVYLDEGDGNVTVNGKDFKEFFGNEISRNAIQKPFAVAESTDKYNVRINVRGGGVTGQAEAVSLAISRCLAELHPEFKKALKDEGLLIRDPRMVERKKFGKKKARKVGQFSKR